MRFLLVITLLSIYCSTSLAQEKVLIANFSIIDGDTFFVADVPEIEVLAFKDKTERNKYYILKRRVLKVYPYALAAKTKLQNIKIGLDSIPKRRHKKRYTKEVEKWVKEEYASSLTITNSEDGSTDFSRT